MPNPFHDVTTVAIDEILGKFIEPSKFGYFLTEIDKKQLTEELVRFVETSRNLKERGDKLLADRAQPPTTRPQR